MTEVLAAHEVAGKREVQLQPEHLVAPGSGLRDIRCRLESPSLVICYFTSLFSSRPLQSATFQNTVRYKLQNRVDCFSKIVQLNGFGPDNNFGSSRTVAPGTATAISPGSQSSGKYHNRNCNSDVIQNTAVQIMQRVNTVNPSVYM